MFAGFALTLLGTAAIFATPCEELTRLDLDGATVTGASVVAESPAMRAVFGEAVRVAEADVTVLLLGDSDLGPSALFRFYSLHVFILPLLAGIFLMVHFWRVRRDGKLASRL